MFGYETLCLQFETDEMNIDKAKEDALEGRVERPAAEVAESHAGDREPGSGARRKSRSRVPSRGDDGGLFAPHDDVECMVNGVDGERDDAVDLRVRNDTVLFVFCWEDEFCLCCCSFN